MTCKPIAEYIEVPNGTDAVLREPDGGQDGEETGEV